MVDDLERLTERKVCLPSVTPQMAASARLGRCDARSHHSIQISQESAYCIPRHISEKVDQSRAARVRTGRPTHKQ